MTVNAQPDNPHGPNGTQTPAKTAETPPSSSIASGLDSRFQIPNSGEANTPPSSGSASGLDSRPPIPNSGEANTPSRPGSESGGTPSTAAGPAAGSHWPGHVGLGPALEGVLAELANLSLRVTKALGKLLLLSPLVLLIALLAVVAWWYEHDAHFKQASELAELKKETEVQVAKLRVDAETATRQANQINAQQIRDLEAQRSNLERNAETLRQQLALLGERERSQVEQVATLPAPEVAHSVASALGLSPNDLGTADAGSRTETPGPQSAPAGTPSAAPGSVGAVAAGANPPYELSEQGLRRIDTALVQLDSCRKQAAVRDQEVTNCQQQAATSQNIIAEQKASIDKLNTALADKDQILAREQQSNKEQMRIVRGSWPQRTLRVAEHVAIGVAIGLAIRH
jgi:hypothetical protein